MTRYSKTARPVSVTESNGFLRGLKGKGSRGSSQTPESSDDDEWTFLKVLHPKIGTAKHLIANRPATAVGAVAYTAHLAAIVNQADTDNDAAKVAETCMAGR